MKKIFISLFVLCAMFFVTTGVNADEISVGLPKVSVTSNTSNNDDFYVTLERLDESSPMPGNTKKVTIKVNSKTGATFDSITFNKRGTYKYKIYQDYMSNSKINYDKSVYTLTISIVNKTNMTFDLKAVTVLEKSGTDIKQSEVTFNNIYSKEKNNKSKTRTRLKIVNPYTGDDITKYFVISFVAVILLVILMIYVKNSKNDD